MKQLANSSVSIWRAALGTMALAAATMAGTAHAADNYPSKPITLVIPYSAGGSTDILGRLLAQKLGESMNASVIVENKPGANGTIGVDRVAKAAPDGYTIVLGDVGGLAISPSLYPKLPYQPMKDLVPVSLVGRSPLVLTVGNNSPLKSLNELTAAAKAEPSKLNYPSSGTGGPNHMGGELYAMQANVKVTHVPYKGSAPSVVSLVAGETDFGFLTAVTINAQLKAGNLRALAVAHDSRLPAMPDVPTMNEAGLKGFMADAWFMAAVPAGTPQPIVDRLYREIAKILPQEDVKAKLDSVGVLPAGLSPKASTTFLRNEIAKWNEVVKTAKITLD
ncbi:MULTISPECIES: tripartite tricarboxylate transporter substrate binding protein [Comamonas]|uniref:Tripartite tricarboxylate transporter substrate binding protein n=1 Tax=Comamonas avium TaxID=2762231 RepID=A0ABR8S7M3_9BURK|nr:MULTISPECIES: tripartite tricarboxylate transporter substrate binding protein [Comamonas]MBD7959485.1 tripartite tricarboxylate transporter substrate binding protein [Comamonas avium]MBD9402965.1 tripartite tricarboxylate transporter substrate binding protein [Comamonas sp. CMM02]